jgi:electron transfer flavoprotein alpha subunit
MLLLIAGHNQEQLTAPTLVTLTAAKTFGVPIHVVVIGQGWEKAAHDASRYQGVEKVWTIDHPSLVVEEITPTLVELCKGYDFILAPSTSWGKNILPRLAALLDVAQLSDVVAILDPHTFVCPIHTGEILATVRSRDPIKMMTIRPTAFEKAHETSDAAPVAPYPFIPFSTPSPRLIKLEKHRSKRPDLTTASLIVAGGRGIENQETFSLLEELADQLGAAIGASRPLVDAGFVPPDCLVGQTGKVVAPDLYIAVGISGAIQHVTGMRESKVIVAINRDPEAPIFRVADYGLIGDASTILRELVERLRIQES